MISRVALAALAIATLGSVQCSAPHGPRDDHAHHHHDSTGGSAHLAISCGGDAQRGFDAGFFLLHNMEYAAARDAFTRTAAARPTCAMTWWGVAMTYFHPLWPGQATTDELRGGADAVARARAASEADATERAYVAAVAAYYEDWEHTPTAGRLARWKAAQQQLAEARPDDLEAQAFAAVARLATVDKKDKTYGEAREVANLLEGLLAKHPDHPGLMHYLLHAYDNPQLASQGVEIARKYIATSPDAAHALHMPSHIYTRLGNWTEVIASNVRSAEAALKHPAPGGRVSRDFLHATDYLVYAYLQIGDDDRARAAAAKIDAATPYELASGPGAYALAATPARLALERGAWREAAALVARRVPYDWDHYPWAEAVAAAARGLGAARAGAPDDADAAVAELDRLIAAVESPWWRERGAIERDVVAAWIAHARGDEARAEELLRGASVRELAAGKDNVEPGHVIYATEQLAELLLELKRPAQALDAFRAVLADSPRRFAAVAGAGRAAEAAGKLAEAKAYYRQLVEIAGASPRSVRAHAERFLAEHD
jgi:hypothetical protein